MVEFEEMMRAAQQKGLEEMAEGQEGERVGKEGERGGEGREKGERAGENSKTEGELAKDGSKEKSPLPRAPKTSKHTPTLNCMLYCIVASSIRTSP